MKNSDTIRFGINFLPNRATELVDWVKTAEDTGFDIAGIADSKSLYRDVYICEALAAVATRKIRIGTRVINPITRHPAIAACAAATMEELAPGRTMVGVGTGDSAVDNIGMRPSTRAELAEYIRALRELLTTGRTNFTPKYAKEEQRGVYTGEDVKLTWWANKKHPDLYRRIWSFDVAACRRDRRRRRHQYRACCRYHPGIDRSGKNRL